MDRRINTMPRGGGQSAEPIIQRPPISRTANPRESFPGRLVVPSISSQLDIPSVNVIPPLAPVHSTPATRTFDRNNRSSVYTNYYIPTHQARHFSISSSTTHYTQRTQSTFHVIPTRTHSTSKHHRRGQASYSSTTAGLGTQTQSSTTPIQFFKRSLRRGSNTGGDKHDIDPDAYQELESQATEPGAGFQYAATPAVTNSLNADGIRQDPPVPTLAPAVRSRAGLSPSPVPGFGEKRCITISLVGSVKLFEEFAKKLKALFRGGRKGGAWKTSLKRKGSRGQTSRVEMGECYHFTDRGDPHHKHTPRSASGHGKNEDILSWDQGEIVLRIKNNGTGSCVFKVTPAPGNPHELIETPLPMSYLKSQLFVHSRDLVRSLEDWNRHFQNPPPHWVINFVPNAYLRRGLHLAEEVAQYFRTHGLNIGTNAGGVQQVQWKIEYEAIGHKACLVDEHPKSHVNGGSRPGQNSTLKVAWDNGGRERHPSRCWERKEGWDGCKGLVVGIAL